MYFVTDAYKAFDVDLHCPVTLKVISDAPAMEMAR
jgi:hypothetical protein